MNVAPVLPIVVPLLGALAALAGRRWLAWQRGVGIVTSFLMVVVAGWLLARVWSGGVPLVLHTGGWAAPFGITLVVDLLAALMLLVSAVLATAVAVYACGDLEAERFRFGFVPLTLIMMMGVNGAFLAGDIFNLYVWFEVLLSASFVLLALGGERRQMEGSVKYVTLNLISSALFLAGVGLLYGMAGTLNMAQLAQLVASGALGGEVTLSAVLFLTGFGIKAGIFPLFFWLPASYPTPPASVSAIFSGLLTKVGVYALMRFFTLIFVQDMAFTHGLLLVLAGLTMLSGVFGAASQFEMRAILSFHIVSQIGYMLMGLGLQTELALAGTIFFLIHNMIAKSNLFLVSGAVLHLKGTTQLKQLGGLYRERPLLSVLFLLSAMSLAGVPPLSGFVAKLLLIMAALRAEQWLVCGVGLFVGIWTLYSMTKIWANGFWASEPEERVVVEPVSRRRELLLLAPVAVLALLTVLVGVGGVAVFEVCREAAGQLLDRTFYIEHVLGGGPR
ncbi:MAG: Na+/H+ antiporter subunit D [Kiritimatiellaceae bacterium]|nr:MAG: Na+/H+ antiporter subunit D [Kiritimatiellaceae bacterium]